MLQRDTCRGGQIVCIDEHACLTRAFVLPIITPKISRMTLPDSYRQQGHKRFVVDIWIVVSNKVQQSGNCLSVSLIMKVTTFLADRATNLLNINRFKPWKSQDNEICCLERERLNWKIKFCFNQGWLFSLKIHKPSVEFLLLSACMQRVEICPSDGTEDVTGSMIALKGHGFKEGDARSSGGRIEEKVLWLHYTWDVEWLSRGSLTHLWQNIASCLKWRNVWEYYTGRS